jgi:hypothetical protein
VKVSDSLPLSITHRHKKTEKARKGNLCRSATSFASSCCCATGGTVTERKKENCFCSLQRNFEGAIFSFSFKQKENILFHSILALKEIHSKSSFGYLCWKIGVEVLGSSFGRVHPYLEKTLVRLIPSENNIGEIRLKLTFHS